jgi:tryptophan-rich sensory protein
MDFRTYYNQLNKPSWTPDSSVIGTIWTILYPVIFIVMFTVLSKATTKEISWWIAFPFIINLLLNFSFTPIQMGLRNTGLAALIAGLMAVTILWGMVAIWPFVMWISFAYIPYLIWVSIATVLQTQIWLMNR